MNETDIRDVFPEELTPDELADAGVAPEDVEAAATLKRRPVALPTKSADELREWAKHAEEADRDRR